MGKKKQKKHNVGAPPGELFYTGQAKEERVKLTLIQYNETDFFEEDYYDFSELIKNLKPGFIKWINVDGIHKLELVEYIGKYFNIHPLTLEDIVHVESRPKFEDYGHYVVSIMKMLYYDNHVRSEHLSIVLFEDTVISFQEPHGGDAFDIIRTRLRQGKGRVRKMQADYLSYALIDAVVDCYFNVLEKVGEKVEQLDEEIIYDPHRRANLKLHDLKREVIFLRKQLWPAREMVNNIVRNETDLIKESNDAYLRDLQDHIIRAIDTVESYRETLAGIMDVYLSNNSFKMNEAMKALTVISSIFIPVTFIVGVYGMNFKHMPELESPAAYWIVWIVMLTIMIGMGVYFKRKRWW
ncbi:MAG TPA: magnesium/cobalt transporter CorA [Bacteroidia bacterium]|jgi:magnesium transporter|nr:magnesium/cobalt transporter CorA [Bacteroidia bacterium]